MLKSNQIMVRVGGGYATLQEHIRQVGPFECVKIYKVMKGNPEKGEPSMPFKSAVKFYLTKHKSPDKIVKQYMSSDDGEQMDLFENAIKFLREK